MIVQSIRSVGEPKTDLIFTVAMDDVVFGARSIGRIAKAVDIEAVNIDERMAKVSIIGAGMLGQPGVAAQMFDILSQEGINIEIILLLKLVFLALLLKTALKMLFV